MNRCVQCSMNGVLVMMVDFIYVAIINQCILDFKKW